MREFKLTTRVLKPTWIEYKYEIHAESLEDAVDLLKEGKVNPYDQEIMEDIYGYTPIITEVFEGITNLIDKF